MPHGQKDLKPLPRKRCDNCPKFFPVTKPNKRFCSNRCRIDFNNNKAGFGKLRELLPKMVAREVAEQLAGILSKDVIAGLTELVARFRQNRYIEENRHAGHITGQDSIELNLRNKTPD